MRTVIKGVPSLVMLAIAGAGLIGAMASGASTSGYGERAVQSMGVPVPERAFAVDVVQNGQDFFFEGEVNENGVPAKGTPFVTTGYIYPAGTLDAYGPGSGILSDGEPEFPELVLGIWTCRGWHLQDGDAQSGVVVVTTQTFDFSISSPGNHMLVTDGIELADFEVPFSRPITGGTGRFEDANGQMRQTYLDFNASGGFNMTFATRTREDLN